VPEEYQTWLGLRGELFFRTENVAESPESIALVEKMLGYGEVSFRVAFP